MKLLKCLFIFLLNLVKLTMEKEVNNLLHTNSKAIENANINKPSPEFKENINDKDKIYSNLDSLTSDLNNMKILIEIQSPTIEEIEKHKTSLENNDTRENKKKINLLNLINNSLNSIQEIKDNYQGTESNFDQSFPSLESKKKKQFDNSLLFYNSLSLIMLAMLTGGLIGVVFILFFTFRNDDKQ